MVFCSRSASPWPTEPLDTQVRVVDVPLVGVGNARHRWETRRSVVLVLRDADGRIGLGEAAPLPGLSQDSAEQAYDDLRGQSATPCRSARFALDTALADLRGQRRELPLWRLWSHHAPAALECNQLVQSTPDRWQTDAAILDASCIKLKIGFPGVDVAAHIRALRELLASLPESTRLRLDANGAFSSEQAAVLRDALTDPRIEYIEDPFDADTLDQLLETGCSLGGGLAWAADELWLARPDAIATLAPSDGLAALVLKPTTIGALDESLALARNARARGLDVVLTHAFEGAIAHAAITHLAYAVAGPQPRAMGLVAHAALAPWPSQLDPRQCPRAPGLGLDAQRILRWLDASSPASTTGHHA